MSSEPKNKQNYEQKITQLKITQLRMYVSCMYALYNINACDIKKISHENLIKYFLTCDYFKGKDKDTEINTAVQDVIKQMKNCAREMQQGQNASRAIVNADSKCRSIECSQKLFCNVSITVGGRKKNGSGSKRRQMGGAYDAGAIKDFLIGKLKGLKDKLKDKLKKPFTKQNKIADDNYITTQDLINKMIKYLEYNERIINSKNQDDILKPLQKSLSSFVNTDYVTEQMRSFKNRFIKIFGDIENVCTTTGDDLYPYNTGNKLYMYTLIPSYKYTTSHKRPEIMKILDTIMYEYMETLKTETETKKKTEVRKNFFTHLVEERETQLNDLIDDIYIFVNALTVYNRLIGISRGNVLDLYKLFMIIYNNNDENILHIGRLFLEPYNYVTNMSIFGNHIVDTIMKGKIDDMTTKKENFNKNMDSLLDRYKTHMFFAKNKNRISILQTHFNGGNITFYSDPASNQSEYTEKGANENEEEKKMRKKKYYEKEDERTFFVCKQILRIIKATIALAQPIDIKFTNIEVNLTQAELEQLQPEQLKNDINFLAWVNAEIKSRETVDNTHPDDARERGYYMQCIISYKIYDINDILARMPINPAFVTATRIEPEPIVPEVDATENIIQINLGIDQYEDMIFFTAEELDKISYSLGKVNNVNKKYIFVLIDYFYKLYTIHIPQLMMEGEKDKADMIKAIFLNILSGNREPNIHDFLMFNDSKGNPYKYETVEDGLIYLEYLYLLMMTFKININDFFQDDQGNILPFILYISRNISFITGDHSREFFSEIEGSNFQLVQEGVKPEFINEVITKITKQIMESPQQRSGGMKKDRILIKDLYKCNDGRLRKAFRIKGRGNTKFVTYKGKVVKTSDIPKKNIRK